MWCCVFGVACDVCEVITMDNNNVHLVNRSVNVVSHSNWRHVLGVSGNLV